MYVRVLNVRGGATLANPFSIHERACSSPETHTHSNEEFFRLHGKGDWKEEKTWSLNVL